MTSDIHMAAFDQEQVKAIRHNKGPMLVLAGPGSGKTTVLTHRIHYLNKEYGIPEKDMLVLTFTRAAATEMKDRYMKLKNDSYTEVTFGTFHSVFFRILKQYSRIGELEVCEHEDVILMINSILCELYGEDFCPGSVSEEVYDLIGRMKNGIKVNSELAVRVCPILEKRMRDTGHIDYDDMLVLFQRLLSDDPELLQVIRSRYPYILVDEFQDLNRTQYEILRMLAGPEQNVFAVGDDDQSIYGFRGSDPAFMKCFLKDFRSVKKVVLTANHRSTGEIVKASLRLIRHNRKRFAKRLRSVNAKGLRPMAMSFDNAEKEAEYIEIRMGYINDAARKAGLPEPKYAILARTGAALKEVTVYLKPELKEKISMMTFHGSKGLEFDAVFIVGASEGITPDHRASRDNSEEEERRAFYVAMTRAKRYLHIFNTKMSYNKPVKSSRYIREIFSVF